MSCFWFELFLCCDCGAGGSGANKREGWGAGEGLGGGFWIGAGPLFLIAFALYAEKEERAPGPETTWP